MLPRVRVDSYNAEIRDDKGFIGDRANKRVFQDRLDSWRERLRASSDDPLDSVSTSELYKDKRGLQEVLLVGDPEAAGLLIGAIEDYAQELAKVVHRLLEVDGWQATDRIATGGGFREGRVGELSIGRASVLVKSSGSRVNLVPIHANPDDAALVGGIELIPPEVMSRHDGFLALDIGGTNVRAGIVSVGRDAESERACVRVARAKCGATLMNIPRAMRQYVDWARFSDDCAERLTSRDRSRSAFQHSVPGANCA